MALEKATDRRFDFLSKKVEQQNAAEMGQQKDELRRQFARGGMVTSGAHIKQQQVAADAGAQRLGQAREGIEFAKLAEQEKREALEEQRKFQTSEREASQQFSSGERVASQQFASGEANIQRRYSTGERISSQDFQTDMFNENYTKVVLPKLDIAIEQLGLETAAQEANTKLQTAEAIARGLPGYLKGAPSPVAGAPGATNLTAGTTGAGGLIAAPPGSVAQGNGIFAAPDGSVYKFEMGKGYVLQGRA